MYEELKQAIKLDEVSTFKKFIKQENIETNQKKLFEALYFACKEGKANIAKFLILDKKINPNDKVNIATALSDDGPVFKFAAESGNLELVRFLYEGCHVNIEARGTMPGTQDTALSRAARKGHTEVVKYLLEKGADPNSQISNGTVLFYGVHSGVLEVVTALVSAGAKIKNLEVESAIKAGHFEILQFFVQQGAELNQRFGDYYVKLAVKSGNVALVQYLESQGFEILTPPSSFSWKDAQYELLRAAAESGNVEMMRYLVERYKLDLAGYVQKENNDAYAYKYDAEFSILGSAFESNLLAKDLDKRLVLLHYLFDELKLVPGREALKNLKESTAASSGIKINAYLDSFLTDHVEDKQLLQKISEVGLELDVPTLFYLYTSELITAGCYNHFEDKLRKKIEGLKLSNETLYQYGLQNKNFYNDAIFYYVDFHFDDNFEKLRFLMTQGVDVNLKNKNGENVVFAAARGGYNNIVKYLIAQGADLDQPDCNGLTTLVMLGRWLKDKALEELLNSVKDYTQSLKRACKGEPILIPLLKHFKGEIGNVDVKELLEIAMDSGSLNALLSNVSPRLFDEMARLLENPDLLEKHQLCPKKTHKLLADIKEKRNPVTRPFWEVLNMTKEQVDNLLARLNRDDESDDDSDDEMVDDAMALESAKTQSALDQYYLALFYDKNPSTPQPSVSGFFAPTPTNMELENVSDAPANLLLDDMEIENYPLDVKNASPRRN